jgi:hypothetical protein
MWNIDLIQINKVIWKTGHVEGRALTGEGG